MPLVCRAGTAPEVHEGYLAAPQEEASPSEDQTAARRHTQRGALAPAPPGTLPPPATQFTIKEWQVRLNQAAKPGVNSLVYGHPA